MVTINEQAFLFLACVRTGIIMGMLYDIIRVFRKIIQHPNWAIQLEDLLYWITCGCFAFIMIYWKNYGQIRGFVFLGILIGTILYFSTASILFMKITSIVVDWAKKVINRLVGFLLIPIRCIIKTVRIPIDYIINKHKIIKKRRKIHKQKNKIKDQVKIIQKKK